MYDLLSFKDQMLSLRGSKLQGASFPPHEFGKIIQIVDKLVALGYKACRDQPSDDELSRIAKAVGVCENEVADFFESFKSLASVMDELVMRKDQTGRSEEGM